MALVPVRYIIFIYLIMTSLETVNFPKRVYHVYNVNVNFCYNQIIVHTFFSTGGRVFLLT